MAAKNVVLTFDDACRSHLEFVVPVLQKYGFGATFFISVPERWYTEFPGAFLSGEEIFEIHRLGFEIGNHTLNHPGLREKCDAECRFELSSLNEFLAKYGITAPVSFAYPGGPYAANAAAILPEFGLRFARTTEHDIWIKDKTDPLQIPCFAITDKDEANFHQALELLNDGGDDRAAVILYHGVPDEAHPWCNTSPELFEKHMQYLKENGYTVISMAEFGR